MDIVMRSLGEVRPYDNNPRDNAKAVDAVAASIREFGFQQPIVVDLDNVIIVGHTRYQAAKQLGLTTVPVVVADGLSTEQVKAYRIADNKTGELAEWDFDLLQLEIGELNDAGIDLGDFGFGDKELERLIYGDQELQEGLTDPDAVPETPEEPITQLGDLWIMGDHRLLCGDSTKLNDLMYLMDGNQADAVLTDPPYGVEYVGKTSDALTIENDDAGNLKALLIASLGNAYELCQPGGAWYVAAPAGPQFAEFAEVLGGLGIWRQTLVWLKDSMVLGRSDYHYRHEAIFYGWHPGGTHRSPPDRKQTTIWECDRPKASPDHPTMKPVALYVRMLQNSTIPGNLVLDPFGGSGTTLLACQQTERRCNSMELSPNYCDVIVRRWEEHSGQKAERIESNNRKTKEVAA